MAGIRNGFGGWFGRDFGDLNGWRDWIMGRGEGVTEDLERRIGRLDCYLDSLVLDNLRIF